MDKYGTGQDPYCYPDSRVLRNRLDIRDEEELEDAERELTLLATDAIQFSPPPYDLAYLQAIHRQLFGDLYPWAGSGSAGRERPGAPIFGAPGDAARWRHAPSRWKG